jgi:hypothetical protein
VIVGEIGARWAGKQRKGAEAAGIEIVARGGSFKLEGKPGDMKELADLFQRAKAGAVPAA